MTVYTGNHFIKNPKQGQSAHSLLKQLEKFRDELSDNTVIAAKECSLAIIPADVIGLTEKGDAVLIPFYSGKTLDEITDAAFLVRVVREIIKFYARQIETGLLKRRIGIIHGDLHLGNIIFEEDSDVLVLIDALSKPAEPGYIWVDLLTLSTSICLHPALRDEQSGELHRLLCDEISSSNAPIMKSANLLKAWLLLQLRFIRSDDELLEKWKASVALFRSIRLWLRFFP